MDVFTACLIRPYHHHHETLKPIMQLDLTETSWKPIYWAYSAVLGLVLFVFEAAQILFFDAVRAPNVGVVTQMLLMLVFFGLWTFIPRLIWGAVRSGLKSPSVRFPQLAVNLALLGLLLSAAHLAVLAGFLRIMHAPARGQLSDLIQSFAEVWLGYAGLWLVVYAAVAVAIVYLLYQATRSEPVRLEVRQNGRVFYVAPQDVIWVEACGNYIQVHTADGTYMLRKTLSAITSELGDHDFIRSHRSALVNRIHVQALHTGSGRSEPAVELSAGQKAPLSRRLSGQVKAALKAQPA